MLSNYFNMYTLFSLAFTTLLWPLTWALILLAISLFSKKAKRKRFTLIGAILILLLFSNRYLLSLFARRWDIDPVPLPKGKVYSAAIILGGFTNENFQHEGYFADHSDRLIEGMYLQSSGRVGHIVMSGGNSDKNAKQFTEALWVKKKLLEMHYPDSAVLIEQKSTNTNENAIFTKQLLDSAHLKPPYLLVTSAFHMRRALYLFSKKNIEVIPYPADYMAGNAPLWVMDYFVPNVNVTYDWDFYFKEMAGIVIEHLKT